MPSHISFIRRFADTLPSAVGSPRPLSHTPTVYSMEVSPTPVRSPEMLIWSPEAGALLDLASVGPGEGPEASLFSGNQLPPGTRPYATRYGGHQFGHWAGQLGDGRAIALGEVKNARGESWEVQLKGAGPTPYSRRGDGRAVLRSSLREFLCSEAMHHLGVPTTRALCCVLTGDPVVRDLFYDGNPEAEPGAITTRVAPSFLRFGHFQILAASGETELLKTLLNNTISTYFPDHTANTEEGVVRWFSEVSDRTAKLMAEWLRVGFVHGVMNTDNLSILGLTIDYGPYGWLDIYDPDWTPNTTDAQHGRYRFAQQPAIALWNLTRLAEALSPVFQDPSAGLQKLKAGLDSYQTTFRASYLAMMQTRLGIESLDHPEGYSLLETLEQNLRKTETDPTFFYRTLGLGRSSSTPTPESLFHQIQEAFLQPQLDPETQGVWLSWLTSYLSLQQKNKAPLSETLNLMNKTNPVFVLRNFLVQEVLDALEKGDRAPLDQILIALKNPYELTDLTRPYWRKIPDWARSRPGCSALSCSS